MAEAPSAGSFCGWHWGASPIWTFWIWCSGTRDMINYMSTNIFQGAAVIEVERLLQVARREPSIPIELSIVLLPLWVYLYPEACSIYPTSGRPPSGFSLIHCDVCL